MLVLLELLLNSVTIDATRLPSAQLLQILLLAVVLIFYSNEV